MILLFLSLLYLDALYFELSILQEKQKFYQECRDVYFKYRETQANLVRDKLPMQVCGVYSYPWRLDYRDYGSMGQKSPIICYLSKGIMHDELETKFQC